MASYDNDGSKVAGYKENLSIRPSLPAVCISLERVPHGFHTLFESCWFESSASGVPAVITEDPQRGGGIQRLMEGAVFFLCALVQLIK